MSAGPGELVEATEAALGTIDVVISLDGGMYPRKRAVGMFRASNRSVVLRRS
jgi:hypothetical protein